MSISTYKRWMKESYLYEAEEFKARSKESGKIVYYKTKDAMDAAIKDKKAEPIEKGDDKDDKPDTKKGMDIDTTGGLGGDEEPKDEPEDDDTTAGDVDKLIKHIEDGGISEDDWNKVPPKVKKAFRSKVTEIYSKMKKLDNSEEYEKLDKMQEKLGLQLWQVEGLYKDFVTGDAGPEFDEKPSGEEPSGEEEPEDSDEYEGDLSDEEGLHSAKLKKDDHDAYRSLHNMMQWGSNQDDFRNSLNGIKNDLMKAGREEGSKSEEWALADEIGDLNNATHYKLDDAAEAYANMSPEAQELIADAMAKANESITINGKQGRTGTEEIKVINGKKYRAITESIDKRISVKEVHKWLKGLEEYRYRKIPGVDARRITSFVNNGLSETDLPASLQKKWGNAKYSREKHLADKFVKERISRKLAQNESNHPLKEQYNKLFKNKVVL